MSTFQISLARQVLYSLLHDLRPEVVPLVDAFDIPDQILNSALGRYDGDVYRHMYEWAKQAPRNKSKVCMSVCLPVYVYVCIYVCVYMSVCMYIYLYAYIYIIYIFVSMCPLLDVELESACLSG